MSKKQEVPINMLVNVLSAAERAKASMDLKDWLAKAKPIIQKIDQFLLDCEIEEKSTDELLDEAQLLIEEIRQMPEFDMFKEE